MMDGEEERKVRRGAGRRGRGRVRVRVRKKERRGGEMRGSGQKSSESGGLREPMWETRVTREREGQEGWKAIGLGVHGGNTHDPCNACNMPLIDSSGRP